MDNQEQPQFVHLHCHSHYSLLDGLSKIPDLVVRAKELGMTALALTDHGVMYGSIEFYKACKKHDIKPIIGVEAYMAERSRFDKDVSLDRKNYHLTLLAKNEIGYHNLIKLVSRASLEGFYYKPRMDEELLQEFNEGIICLTGCPTGRFIQALRNRNENEARRILNFYISTFGKENVFVEVTNHVEIEWYTPIIPKIQELSNEFDIPMVATWDSHYLYKDDKEAHNTLLAINTNNAEFKINGDYSFISSQQAYEIFKEIPGAVENTSRVADMVDINIDLEDWQFPSFPLPEGITPDDELRRITYEGAEKKQIEIAPEVKERIEYELKIISMKKYPSYFLCMADFTRHAREVGILTNTRGSAAGSMVSYLSGITGIDPIEYHIPFERFLNPERPSLPDIDLDIADDRRDDLINYAREKYGNSAVAQIGTFGKMNARGVVRDVARALGYPYNVGDRLAKLIPMGHQGSIMTIDKAFVLVPELADMYENENDTREIIDMAHKLEGCARHISVHAAGVVISPTGHIDDFSPVQYDPKGGVIITQYDMYTGGRDGVVGLPKFDFLGIRNISILADSIERVKKIREIDIAVDDIPIDDARTFSMLAKGETLGVFQLASDGMTRWLKELKPTTIHDINAMVALYRPGPMDIIPEYIERKHNPKKITFMDPRTETFLDRSYGLLVYQDDVMLIAINLAGYSWLEADKLRKAMGKKIPELMEAQKEKLVNGLIVNGIDYAMTKDKAEYIWSLIQPFAAYGFNKAHSASYGQLAYRTAYMKANYPAEYMTAIMTAESGDIEKVAEVIEECKKMGFNILPPDINESYSDFTVVVEQDISPQAPPSVGRHGFHPHGDHTVDGRHITNKIRFGLNDIKNFGTEIGKAIIHERKENGLYVSLEDFLERVQHRNLNKKSLESLIMAGALDTFGERAHLLFNMDNLLRFNREIHVDTTIQSSLFSNLNIQPKGRLELEEAPPATLQERIMWEKELLGLYLTGHPLDAYKDKLENAHTNIKHAIATFQPGHMVVLAGVIETIREITTKKNEKMAFAKITDLTGSIEAVLFPNVYRTFKRVLKTDTVIAIKGAMVERNGAMNIIVENIKQM